MNIGSYYAKEIHPQGLTIEQMRELCPSMFAPTKHDSRSKRYSFFPTINIVEAFLDAGFLITQVMQAGARDESREGFTKHLVRVRLGTDLIDNKEEYREGVVVNAHDGTSSYQFWQAVFRKVCLNGLVRGDAKTTLRLAHKSSSLPRIIDSTLTVIEEGAETMKTIETMKQIELNDEQQLLLGKLTMAARFDVNPRDKDAMALIPYTPDQFLRPHRAEDRGNDYYRPKTDLYTTFNVAQENALRPDGYVYYHEKNRGRKKHTLKNIGGIDQSIKLNTFLFAMAEEMARIANK